MHPRHHPSHHRSGAESNNAYFRNFPARHVIHTQRNVGSPGLRTQPFASHSHEYFQRLHSQSDSHFSERHHDFASRTDEMAFNARPATGSEPLHVIDGPGGRILCIADARGSLSTLNKLAAEHKAQAIIHTGDFGFYNNDSLERISDRTLRHLVQYSSLIPQPLRNKLLSADPSVRGPTGVPATATTNMRSLITADPNPLLSEFPRLLDGTLKFDVPVFTVWGACEDVAILERFRVGEYRVQNLQVLDEATTRAIEVGGVRLRLFGLGGAVVMHKLFDNGDGAATIAGGQGTMWTTLLQIGELVDTAQKSYDATETRVLITHASPGREGILAQLALALKADLTISAGLHFRYGVSYNEFSVQHDAENFRNKLLNSKAAFVDIWGAVENQVRSVIDDHQRVLLENALAVTEKVPPLADQTGAASEEPAWKNTWNWNLPDAAFGALVLDVRDGRVSSEMHSQGFNFAYRRNQSSGTLSSAAPVTATAATPTLARAAPATSAPSASVGQTISANERPAAQPPTGPRLPSQPASASVGIKSPEGAGGVVGGNSAPPGPRGHGSGKSSVSHSRKNTGGGANGSTATSAGNTDTESGGPKRRGGNRKEQQQQGKPSPKAEGETGNAASATAPAASGASEWDKEFTPSPKPATTASKRGTERPANKRGVRGKSGGGETSGGESLASGNESGTGGPAGMWNSPSSATPGDTSDKAEAKDRSAGNGERGGRGGRGRGRGGRGGERGGRGGHRGGHRSNGGGGGDSTPTASPAPAAAGGAGN